MSLFCVFNIINITQMIPIIGNFYSNAQTALDSNFAPPPPSAHAPKYRHNLLLDSFVALEQTPSRRSPSPFFQCIIARAAGQRRLPPPVYSVV